MCIAVTRFSPSGSVRSAPGSYKVLSGGGAISALYANNSVRSCINISVLLSFAEKHVEL